MRGQFLLLLAGIAAPQALAQSISVSLSPSLIQSFTGDRVPVTITTAVPVTITLGQASPSVTGSQPPGNGTASVGNSTVSANATAPPSTSSKPTTTLPAAPTTEVDPNGVAPSPGSSQGGHIAGPNDDYVAAATRGAKLETAFAVGVLGVCLGMVQVAGLL